MEKEMNGNGRGNKKRKKKQHLRKVAELCLEKATSEGREVAEKIESIEESPERDGEGVM